MPVFGQKPDTGYSPVRRRGSLWRFLSPISLAAKKSARRRRRDDGAKSRRKRRIRRRLEVSPLRRGREQDEGNFAPAGATFFRSAAKEGKDAPGEPFHKGSPGPLLTAKGLRPIGSPAGVYGGRWTGKKTAPPVCFASPVHPPFSLDNPAPLCYHLLSSI